MRRIIIYLLLITYGNATVQPVMPYVIDAASHILNYQGHIDAVHTHNGKAHVHEEVQKLQEQSDKKYPQSSEKFEKAQKDQIQNEIVSTANVILDKQASYSFYNKNECTVLLNSFFPPPDKGQCGDL